MALGNSGLPTSAITTDTSKTPRATMGGGGAAPTINGSSGVARPASVVKPSQANSANQTDTGGATGTRANPGVTPASMSGVTVRQQSQMANPGKGTKDEEYVMPGQNRPTSNAGGPSADKLAQVEANYQKMQNPGPGSGGTGGGSSPSSSGSSSPSVDTGYDPYAAENAAAAATTSRIVSGVDMAEKINEANNAWQQATQGYGQQSGQIIDQYQNSTNSNLNNYGQNTQGIINNYGQGANANLDTYGQNAQGVRNNYEQNVNQNLSGYANNTGNILDSSLNKMTQEVDSYQQTAQGLIDQLSNITGQELADYAASTGQTIAEATQQINDILKGLQDSLKPVNAGRVGNVDIDEQKQILQEMTNNQRQQAENSINYTVNKAVNELQRAQEDAQDQFQTQRNQVAAEAAQALDNKALYSEMRGDRGGVGQAQYDAIQNAKATNLLKVNQQQTKLATDTQRQIADLRAQGEFDLADQLLKISQESLKELMNLKQWMDEANIGIDEFNIGVEQWEQEYNAKLQQVLAEMGMDATKYTTDLGLNRQQYLTNQRLSAAQNEAALGLDTQQYATGRRLDIAQNDANQRLAREQYMTENQNNLASTLANMDLNREQYLNEGRMNVLQNTTNMNLSNEQYVQQQRQDLNKALAEYGLNNAQYMTNQDINRLTSTLNAYMQNAQNLASTELAAANVTGALSDNTLTLANREAQADRMAAAAGQMLAAGVTPTDAQLKALGWSKDQYKAYKSAMDAAAAAAAAASRRSGGRTTTNLALLWPEIQDYVDSGIKNEEIERRISNAVASGKYSDAAQAQSNWKQTSQNYTGWRSLPD